MVGSWHDDVAMRTFKPSEVAMLTGVGADQQRLWSKRYGSDFRGAPGEGAVRPVWHWDGVQQLAMFADIFSDMGSATIALGMATRDHAQHNYHLDLRDHPDGDIMQVYWFDVPHDLRESLQLGGTTARGWAAMYDYGPAYRPGRSYSYNVSAMQRRLYDRLGELRLA